MDQKIGFEGAFVVECFRPDGSLRWREKIDNIVTNVGLDEILDKFWKGSAYTASHFVGLTDSSPTVAAADTMSSHGGWVEDENYSESVRQTLTLGTVSSQSVDNSASKAIFTMNATTTIGGVFVTTSNTKGGTTDILISVAAFTEGDRAVINLDTINVTYTSTAADDGV